MADDMLSTYAGRTAYSYVRFSTRGQIDGVSLVRQMEAAARIVDQHRLIADETLQMHDLGLSGFSGANRTSGALGVFLEAVKNKRVSSGSILIVEAIDRLSREEALEALDLITSLLRSGIVIVTVEDGLWYSRETLREKMHLIFVLVGKIQQANSESARKSALVRDAWARKRAEARDDGRVVTRMCPGWLRRADDHYEVIAERAAVVHRIFTETVNGIGADSIARRLNQDGVPPFTRDAQGMQSQRAGKTAGWHASYIKKVLVNRAVIGEFQMGRKNYETKNRRVPDGEPIRLFPPVIDMDLWQRAEIARKSRSTIIVDGETGEIRSTGKGGRKGLSFANLLTGIAICQHCQGPIRLVSKGVRRPEVVSPRAEHRRQDYLVCDNARRGLGCANRTHHRYHPLESEVLNVVIRLGVLLDTRRLVEVTAADKLADLRNRLATINDQIGTLNANIDALLSEFGNLSKRAAAKIREQEAEVERLESDRKLVEKALNEYEATDDPITITNTIRSLRDASGQGVFEARSQLHSALREIVDTVWLGDVRTVNVWIGGAWIVATVSADGDVQYVLHRDDDTAVLLGDASIGRPMAFEALYGEAGANVLRRYMTAQADRRHRFLSRLSSAFNRIRAEASS